MAILLALHDSAQPKPKRLTFEAKMCHTDHCKSMRAFRPILCCFSMSFHLYVEKQILL